MLHHLLPAAAVVHDEHAAARHGFKADARPVFRGVGGLQDDAAVLVERLLRDLALVVGDLNPVEGAADFLLAALVEAEEKPVLGEGRNEGVVDAQRVGGEFVGILPGDSAAAEEVRGALGDERECLRMEIRLEGEELHLRVIVELAEGGHHALPHGFILVEEHGDLPFLHRFFFLVKKPGHAVHEDGAPGVLANLRQGAQKISIAEAEDGVSGPEALPIARGVHDDAESHHLLIERLADALPGWDEVYLQAELAPDDDLVVELSTCAAVEAGEAMDKYALDVCIHDRIRYVVVLSRGW